MDTKSVLKWVGIGFLVVSLGLLIGSAVTYVSTKNFIASAVTATGKVIDLAERRDDEGDMYYYPVIAFETADGEAIEFVSSTGTDYYDPSQISETVSVLYDPTQPQNAVANTWFQLWFGFSILLILGVMLLLFGGSMVSLARSNRELNWVGVEEEDF